MAISLALLVWNWKQRIARTSLLYAGAVVFSFAAMSALVMWQATTSRYHLPIFVLGAAFVGIALDCFVSRRVVVGICALLLIFGALAAATNRARSIIPVRDAPNIYQDRLLLYFGGDFYSSRHSNYRAAAAAVESMTCNTVAIDSVLPDPPFRNTNGALLTYPLFALINPDGRTKAISFTGVHNKTARYQKPDPEPCAIVCFNCADVPTKWAEYRKIGGRATVAGPIVVFGAEGDVANSP